MEERDNGKQFKGEIKTLTGTRYQRDTGLVWRETSSKGYKCVHVWGGEGYYNSCYTLFCEVLLNVTDFTHCGKVNNVCILKLIIKTQQSGKSGELRHEVI